MNINNMVYRTKTYIAGDWTGDADLIQKLIEWNNNRYLDLNFVNVHEVTSSSDSTLNCNIKRSLRKRMSISKTFVLIIGNNTFNLSSGACHTCRRYYNVWNNIYDRTPYCANGGHIDNRSYIKYECEMALKDYYEGKLKNIVIIYNGLFVPDLSRCPYQFHDIGIHIGSYQMVFGKVQWAYNRIKEAICK